MRETAGVVVPLRSFSDAKARLAPVLDRDARASLARSMAERVVSAIGDSPAVVVSSAPDVVAWAKAQGLEVIDDPGTLDAAADAGRRWVRTRSLARVVVVHGDLPLATSLDAVDARVQSGRGVAIIVPDHRDDGTPVLSLPAETPFVFAYGPGSAQRHADEARRCGLEVRIVRDPELGFDIDIADDLRALENLRDRSRS
jgi:2-phospho-L-lactate guanylyltransferase